MDNLSTNQAEGMGGPRGARRRGVPGVSDGGEKPGAQGEARRPGTSDVHSRGGSRCGLGRSHYGTRSEGAGVPYPEAQFSTSTFIS